MPIFLSSLLIISDTISTLYTKLLNRGEGEMHSCSLVNGKIFSCYCCLVLNSFTLYSSSLIPAYRTTIYGMTFTRSLISECNDCRVRIRRFHRMTSVQEYFKSSSNKHGETVTLHLGICFNRKHLLKVSIQLFFLFHTLYRNLHSKLFLHCISTSSPCHHENTSYCTYLLARLNRRTKTAWSFLLLFRHSFSSSLSILMIVHCVKYLRLFLIGVHRPKLTSKVHWLAFSFH